jgi:hypothetical protein
MIEYLKSKKKDVSWAIIDDETTIVTFSNSVSRRGFRIGEGYIENIDKAL